MTGTQSTATQSAPPDLLRTALREHSGSLLLASALVVSSAFLEVVPYLVVYAAALEVFAPTPDGARLLWLAGAAFGAVVVRFLLLGGGYVVSHAVAFSYMRRLRLRLTAKLARVPGRFFHAHPSGDLKKAIIDDVASLEAVFAHYVPEAMTGAIVPVLAATILFATDWRLGLVALAMAPVAIGVQAFVMRDIGEMYEEWHAAEARANEGVLEFIRGVVVLKAFDRDASSLGEVRDGIEGIRDLAIALTKRSIGGYALFFTLLSGNLLIVLPAGLSLYLAGAIGRDELVLLVALGTGILLPLLKLLFLFGNAQQVSKAAERVRDVLAAEELNEPEAPGPLPTDHTVRFDAVTFTYAGRDEPALRDVSLELPAGQITALVGSSGAGKSTVLRLLLREHDPDVGRITVGGEELRSLTSGQRTELFSHVSQDTTLFDDSALDNLRLARPDAGVTEVEAAARAAHAHEFLEDLPLGYETPLGDRGGQLSGGERQRLAIARALLKDAPILVLDEITANVDPESERGIQEGLARLARGRTVLLVAHRLRSVTGVHRILVMDGGRVVDAGSHEELLDRCPAYATLWTAQRDAAGWTLKGGASC